MDSWLKFQPRHTTIRHGGVTRIGAPGMPIGYGVSLPVGEHVELKRGVRYHLRGWGTLRHASGNWASSYAA